MNMGFDVGGTGVYGGCVYAPAVWVSSALDSADSDASSTDVDFEDEIHRFVEAADSVAAYLARRSEAAEGETAAILAADAIMARDRAWRRDITRRITDGLPVIQAVTDATKHFAGLLEKAGSATAARTADLFDVRDRVVTALGGSQGVTFQFDSPVVVLADDISPARAEELDPEKAVALVMARGSAIGHTAIVARSRGIPCVVGVGEALYRVRDGDRLFVDAASGLIRVNPDPLYAHRAAERSKREESEIRKWTPPAKTQDGHRVRVLANVAGRDSAKVAAGSAAEGIGLYRTELSFMDRASEPTVAEQADYYKEVMEAFNGRHVVVRTFDIGADKPVGFYNAGPEPNPALGVRGIRTTSHHQASDDSRGMLTRQLDAIAIAARATRTRPWVMAPMMTTLSESRDFAESVHTRGMVAGAMIEVPAAALMADSLASSVDFMSIGTNDLTQYVMAADRLSPELGSLLETWQPAVLRIIKHAVTAGRHARIPVSVCGEAAADPLLACVLVGFGVTSLSMSPIAIPAVGIQISKVTLSQCKEAARRVVTARGPAHARNLASEVLLSS